MGALVGALMAADMLLVPNSIELTNGGATHGSEAYSVVVDRVRDLPGKVASPEDPTIAFFAKGFVGRGFHTELDTTGNRTPPEPFLRELKRSKWIVRVKGTWAAPKHRMDIEALGFHRVRDPAFADSFYSLWVRPASTHPAGAATVDGTD